MAAHTFNHSTREAKAVNLCEFEASPFCIVHSRTIRATWRDPVSKKLYKKKTKNISSPLKTKDIVFCIALKKETGEVGCWKDGSELMPDVEYWLLLQRTWG